MFFSPSTRFVAWMAFLCLAFTSITILGLLLQLRLESTNQQDRLYDDFKLTIFFAYMYFRLALHVITDKILMSSSPIYQDMPEGLRRDCAFMCVDGPSLLMWLPLTLYLVVVILQEQDREAVLERVGSLIYVGSATYQFDRLLHVFNGFRLDRFFHHLLTCIWMLFILEWAKSELVDFSFLMFAWTMDICGGRVSYYWFFIGRFARRHARNSPDWSFRVGDEEDDESGRGGGADQMIVPNSPYRMALYGKFVFLYGILTFIVGAVGVQGIYFHYYSSEMHTFWRIIVYPMLGVYLVLDKAFWTTYVKYSKESYWRGILLVEETTKGKEEIDDGTVTKNRVELHHSASAANSFTTATTTTSSSSDPSSSSSLGEEKSEESIENSV